MPNSLKCKIKHLCHNRTITESECDRILKALEQEPKTGHWIKTGYIDKVTCSICKRKMWNFWEVNDFNYCPNCGEKMVDPMESEV